MARGFTSRRGGVFDQIRPIDRSPSLAMFAEVWPSKTSNRRRLVPLAIVDPGVCPATV
jgi:hypothetical protein